jgi:hypothetical protein
VASIAKELQAAAQLELRRRKRTRVEAVGLLNHIPEEMSFREWCEKLATDPDVLPEHRLRVDGRPFRLDNRPALVPIYDAIPRTRMDAYQRMLVIQKATQLGLTVWEVLANIYMAVKFGPITIGMFLPDQATASYKSEHRFMRIVRSVPSIYRAMTHATRGEEERRVGEGNVLTRTLGESIFLFLWTTGKVTTESRPMDVVTLDEVQEMELGDIEKVRARLGDSDLAFVLMLSTANMPEMDINFWYLQGTQEVWHTKCESCGALSDLSDPAGVFPAKSVGYNTGQFPGYPINEYVWLCPCCGMPIADPQNGEYIAANPGAAVASGAVTVPGAKPTRITGDENVITIAGATSVRSFLLPRTISPRNRFPRQMVEDLARAKTGDQKKSYYNRTLARPYIDADQLPVSIAHCKAAEAAGLEAGLVWEKSGAGYYMGIDQMGSFNAVIIKKRMADGRQAVVHVEAVFNDDPFARCGELMDLYGIVVCVVEQLPNVNDARKFANKFRGRVFLASYADLRDDQMSWGDQLTRSERKTSEEDRSRYMVTLNQYKCMQTALYRIRGELVDGKLVPMCLFPRADDLEQDVIDNGVTKRIPLLRDWVWYHFTKTALVIEDDPETRKPRGRVQKVGIDPHYAFANMLCDVAWARQHGTSTIFLPHALEAPQMQKDIKEAMPGLPPAVVAMVEDHSVIGEVCGACNGFDKDRSYCTERGFKVSARDPGCTVFVAVESITRR